MRKSDVHLRHACPSLTGPTEESRFKQRALTDPLDQRHAGRRPKKFSKIQLFIQIGAVLVGIKPIEVGVDPAETPGVEMLHQRKCGAPDTMGPSVRR